MHSKFEILPVAAKGAAWIPLVTSKIKAGFPSPAEDYVESGLDLNEFLIQSPSSTFVVRVEGDSMTGAGIFHGNYLIVDRSLEPSNGHIVLAVVNGDFTVKRFIKKNKAITLQSENVNYPSIRINADMEFSVWGVVTSVIAKTI